MWKVFKIFGSVKEMHTNEEVYDFGKFHVEENFSDTYYSLQRDNYITCMVVWGLRFVH